MDKRLLLSFFCCLLSAFLFGQLDTVRLDTLNITSKPLETKVHIKLLLDSSTVKQSASLGQLLQTYTPVYIKEQGYGMVSSPSFRGTTAQQTNVQWNGISINSRFLGQTDFNTVFLDTYQHVEVKPGGSSVVDGSGAIGGTILLENEIDFKKDREWVVRGKVGNFDTYGIFLKGLYSWNHWHINASYARNQSENEYEVKKIDYTNHNGQFYNETYNVNAGYKINRFNTIHFFNQYYRDQRHFSLVESTGTKTKYRNHNYRSLLEWQWGGLPFTSQLKTAYLFEQYQYHDELTKPKPSSQAHMHSVISQYDASYLLPLDIKIAGQFKYAYHKAEGKGSGIVSPDRQETSLSGQWSQKITPALYYELGVRKNWTDDFDTPWLYSLGINGIINANHTVKVNHTKNFRVPTFNDLFWEPGGNLNLKSEESQQWEMNYIYHNSNHEIKTSLYSNHIKDMIRWLPTPNGYWQARNTASVQINGAEMYWNLGLYNHKIWKLKCFGNYAYTVSKNKETKQPLIYVPKHKLNIGFQSIYNKFTFRINPYYISDVNVTEDVNTPLRVKAYSILNASLYYSAEIKEKTKYVLGIQGKNITNVAYEAVKSRIMPPIHFLIDFKLTL